MRNSKLILFAAVALSAILGISAASAADMAPAPAYTKAPPVVAPPVISWTGFYIGGEGGGGWGRDRIDFPGSVTTSTGRFDTSGGIAGGVVGYNWQGSSWVFGVEGNFDWANIRGSTICPNPTDFCRTNLNEIFTGTGRIGYTWNNVLLYAKGGYAWTQDRYQGGVLATGVVVEQTSLIGRSGYTFGAGLEYMVAPNWSAKVEYDYYNFNSKAVNSFGPTGLLADAVTLTSYSVNAVKAGVNYHFNWGPVVARY